MTLQQLKYIIEIVNCGSMNLAAQKLFVSQPSLSNAVKELEKELGIEIFIRTNKGVTLSSSGQEFLGYARQIIEQTELLEQRYHKDKPARRLLAVSTQHYAFSVNAFVNLIKEYAQDEYDFTLRETKTHEIIDDVKNMRSEIGVLYLSKFNEQVIRKILQENDLCFKELFTANPHVFLSAKHPLAGKKIVTFDDLELVFLLSREFIILFILPKRYIQQYLIAKIFMSVIERLYLT
jgi:DNA-binding transcriptional LysR family regulator